MKAYLSGKRVAVLILCSTIFVDAFTSSVQRYHSIPLRSGQHGKKSVPHAASIVAGENNNADNNSVKSTSSKWQANDVYTDLQLLEQAIAYKNAENNLQATQRKETLDYIASRRWPLHNDVWKYIVKPSAFTLAAILYMQFICKDTVMIAKLLNKALAVHFWIFTYALPLTMLFFKTWNIEDNEEPPAELQDIDPQYLKFVSSNDWQHSSYCVRDHVRCILEQWSSAVVGAIFFIPYLSAPSCIIARMITRLGVVASLHQFPKLWYELEHSKSPKPWWVTATQQATASLRSTWSIAAELALVLVREPTSTVIAVYGAMTAIYWIVRLFPPPPIKPFHKIKLPPAKYVFLAASLWYMHEQRVMFRTFRRIAQFFGWKNFARFMYNSSKQGIWNSITMFGACILPMLHLAAWRRIFRIQYMHDVSLSNNTAEFNRILKDERKQRYKWRYSLQWREPRRIRTVVEDFNKKMTRWALLYGSVDEKLDWDRQTAIRKEAQQEGSSILDRLAQEKKEFIDRDEWKKNAMESMEKKHQSDFESGEYDDPLGISLYRTLGIGLGFQFDHTSKLAEDEEPSLRRLQARAVKSTIRHVQQLYGDKATKEILDSIKDPAERDEKAAQLRQETEQEIQYLADKLTELIPTQGLPPDIGIPYDAVAAQRHIGQSIANLLRKYGSSIGSNNTTIMQDDPFHDEFLSQWSKKQESNDDNNAILT